MHVWYLLRPETQRALTAAAASRPLGLMAKSLPEAEDTMRSWEASPLSSTALSWARLMLGARGSDSSDCSGKTKGLSQPRTGRCCGV